MIYDKVRFCMQFFTLEAEIFGFFQAFLNVPQ